LLVVGAMRDTISQESSDTTGAHVALLLAGDLRTFIESGNWRSWSSRVIAPLENRGMRVDTFLCTSPSSAALQADRNASAMDGLPDEIAILLRVVKWLRRTASDFDRSMFACVLDAMGCLANATALWTAQKVSKKMVYPQPHGFTKWLESDGRHRSLQPKKRVNLAPYRFLDKGTTLCPRFAVMLVRGAECYMAAKDHSRLAHGKEYDWYMHGRPDMAWYEDVVMPDVLQPDAVSLRARELWGHSSFDESNFKLTDNMLSYNWWGGPQACGGQTACPRLAKRPGPCLLADDQWAWIPRRHASAYYVADAGCQPPIGLRDRSLHAHRKSVRPGYVDAGFVDVPETFNGYHRRLAYDNSKVRPAWDAKAFNIIYNGEGLLTARLLQLGVPVDIVPAALRFHPTKKGGNWNRFEKPLPCLAQPCKGANRAKHLCTPRQSSAEKVAARTTTLLGSPMAAILQ